MSDPQKSLAWKIQESKQRRKATWKKETMQKKEGNFKKPVNNILIEPKDAQPWNKNRASFNRTIQKQEWGKCLKIKYVTRINSIEGSEVKLKI